MIPVFLIVVRANLPACEAKPAPPPRDILAEGVRRIKRLECRESKLVNQVSKLPSVFVSTKEIDAGLKKKMHEAGEHLNIYHAYNFSLYAALTSGKLAEFEKHLVGAKQELDGYERILKDIADEFTNAERFFNRRYAGISR